MTVTNRTLLAIGAAASGVRSTGRVVVTPWCRRSGPQLCRLLSRLLFVYFIDFDAEGFFSGLTLHHLNLASAVNDP
jgi:hypothetical protein